MAKKENKTNAMRILDKNKIVYTINNYECDEFVNGRFANVIVSAEA